MQLRGAYTVELNDLLCVRRYILAATRALDAVGGDGQSFLIGFLIL